MIHLGDITKINGAEIEPVDCITAETPAFDRAIEALTEPTVIRSKTLMPTKDFKEWAKRVRENNPSVIVIPCDAEVVPVETTATNTEKSSNCGDLISRADAMGTVQDHFNADGFKGYDDGQKMMDRIKALPSADRPQGEWINVDNYYRLATCSNCQKVTMFEKWGECTKPYNYCLNCGADMRKKNNE